MPLSIPRLLPLLLGITAATSLNVAMVSSATLALKTRKGAALEQFAKADTLQLRAFLQSREGLEAAPGEVASLGSAAGAVGLPSEAVLVRGLVQFLATRAQEEVILAYQTRLEEGLEDSDFACLMPGVRQALSYAGSVGPHAALPNVAKAFAADVDNLAYQLANRECSDKLLGKVPNKEWLQVGLDLYGNIRKSGAPISAIAKWAVPAAVPSEPRSLRPWLAVIGLVASECQNKPALLTVKDLDAEEVSLMVQAVIARLRTDFQVDTSIAKQIAVESQRIESILRRLRQIDAVIRDASPVERSTPKAASELLLKVIENLGALLRDANIIPVNQADTALAKSFEMLDTALRIHQAIVEREWVTVGERLLFALRTTKGDVDDRIVRVIVFASSLASSTTPEQVAEVLKSVTLPAGSYRAKRREGNQRAPSHVGLNAYLGYGMAFENHRAAASPAGNGRSIGIHAPIGFEWSVGTKFGGLPVTSFSVLASVLNPGNLTQVYYRDGGSLEEADDLHFRDIFAPGLFAAFGLWHDLPISVVAGWELCPRLRVDASTSSRTDIQRITILVGLDMPLIRF